MVIVMQEGATDAQIQHVIDRLVASGFNVHRSTGESHTVLGAVGVHRDFDHRDFELLDGVREVMRITQPFKLASRQFKPEGTIVDLGRGVKIGGPEVAVAAGPCSVESREQIHSIAERLPLPPQMPVILSFRAKNPSFLNCVKSQRDPSARASG